MTQQMLKKLYVTNAFPLFEAQEIPPFFFNALYFITY